jgi:hypothetical protein
MVGLPLSKSGLHAFSRTDFSSTDEGTLTGRILWRGIPASSCPDMDDLLSLRLSLAPLLVCEPASEYVGSGELDPLLEPSFRVGEAGGVNLGGA